MNKNLLKTGIILLAVTFVTLQSCEKKTLNVEDKTIVSADENSQDTKFIYYIDNKEVGQIEFNAFNNNNKEPFIFQTVKKDEKTDVITTVLYSYSSENGYIEYGKRHNLKLKEGLEFEKHMREYAEKSGAISEFENTGKIPESYIKYENEHYGKVFGVQENNKNLAFFLYEYCGGGQYLALLPHHSFPFLSRSWRNRISRVENIGIVGLISFYDKSFYRRRLITVNLYISNSGYCLTGNEDNATESVIAW